MKLVAGSYERFVWAWDANLSTGELIQSFCRPAHLGPIKCATGWGMDLVTGGSDDNIHIFDVHSSRDIGLAEAHTGSVTSLQFYGDSNVKATHLFSASEDGSICVWDTDGWVHLKTMKGKSGVSDFTVHASGRLGLSVEKGGGFRMWNLVKGRCSFSRKLESEATLVRFMPREGNSYVTVCDRVVNLNNAEDGRTLQALYHEHPVLCLVSGLQDELVFTGGEDCSVNAWDFRAGKVVYTISDAHSMRVKGIDVLGDSYYLASASSDGFVKVWDTRMAGSENPTALVECDTKARLTCITGFSSSFSMCGKAAEGKVADGERETEENEPAIVSQDVDQTLETEGKGKEERNKTEKKRAKKKKRNNSAAGDEKNQIKLPDEKMKKKKRKSDA